MSEFNKHVGKFIAKDQAEKQIKNWKKTGLKTQSSFFGSDILLNMINRDGVVGIRIHYALDDENNLQPVLTPEYGDDATTVATRTTASTSSTDDYGDASLSCPPYCPKPQP